MRYSRKPLAIWPVTLRYCHVTSLSKSLSNFYAKQRPQKCWLARRVSQSDVGRMVVGSSIHRLFSSSALYTGYSLCIMGEIPRFGHLVSAETDYFPPNHIEWIWIVLVAQHREYSASGHELVLCCDPGRAINHLSDTIRPWLNRLRSHSGQIISSKQPLISQWSGSARCKSTRITWNRKSAYMLIKIQILQWFTGRRKRKIISHTLVWDILCCYFTKILFTKMQ